MGNASYTEDINDQKQENKESTPAPEPSTTPSTSTPSTPDSEREEYRNIDGEPGS